MYTYNTPKRTERIAGVYMLKNLVTKKVYVGSSKHIYQRWQTHYRKLFNKNHQNSHLQNSWDKYGKGVFVFGILEITDDLINRENYYIELYDAIENGYNKGIAQQKPIFTPEAREKMSKAKRGRKLSEEHKRKLSEAGKGQKRPHSEATKNKIRNANSGKKRSSETKRKLSESAKKRVYSPEEKERLSKMFKGKKRSEETKQKIRESWAKRKAQKEE